MNSVTNSTAARSRPGGRTAQTTERIHAAVLTLLIAGGPDACTFTSVAIKAGVERSTLYRRYGNRWAMISDSYAAKASRDLAIEPTGDFRADMTAHLRKIAASMESTLGRAMIVAAAAARLDRSPEAGRYWQSRLRQLQPIVDAAVASGQMAPGIDCEELFAASDGPLFFLLLVVGKTADERVIARIVDDLCAHYCRTKGESRGRQKETAS